MEYRLQITVERMKEVRLILGSDSCGKMSAAECREVHYKEKLGRGEGEGEWGGEKDGRTHKEKGKKKKESGPKSGGRQMKGVNLKMRLFIRKESSGIEEGGRSWVNSRI